MKKIFKIAIISLATRFLINATSISENYLPQVSAMIYGNVTLQ